MRDLKSYITESKKDYFKALCKLNTRDFEKVILNVKNDEYIQDNMFKELYILIDDVVWMMQDVRDEYSNNQEIVDIYGIDWIDQYILDICDGPIGSCVASKVRYNLVEVMSEEFKKIMKLK